MNKLFMKGVKHGLPIGLGYLSVIWQKSFANVRNNVVKPMAIVVYGCGWKDRVSIETQKQYCGS